MVGEIKISEAQKWASLAAVVGHETLIHFLYNCQSGGICKLKNQSCNSLSGNESSELAFWVV